jgi:hypothetical protein
MMVVKFVDADGISGMIDVSTTRSAEIPLTSPYASTTALGSESEPMGTVDAGCR